MLQVEPIQNPPFQVRERHYIYDHSIPKYYDHGNVVLTAEWNALAIEVLHAERFVINAVKKLANRTKSPDLSRRINIFLGQEAMHSKETLRMLQPLINRGFPVSKALALLNNLDRRWQKRLPFAAMHLKTAISFEHYVLLIAIWYFKNEYGENFPRPLREIWNWHFAEELEHRSVAFDLLEEIYSPTYLNKAPFYFTPLMITWFFTRKLENMILKWEGLSKWEIRQERMQARKIRPPLFSWRMPNLWRFLKFGFHPNQLGAEISSQAILSKQEQSEEKNKFS